jgi:predicted nucleotidyltransferase
MTDLAALLSKVCAWAERRPEVRAVLLVGSHARGEARPDSDVDLVILADHPRALVDPAAWARVLGPIARSAAEEWGPVTSLRVFLADGPEVELSFGAPSWITDEPVDAGTARVIGDGAVVLHDRLDGLAGRIARILTARGR